MQTYGAAFEAAGDMIESKQNVKELRAVYALFKKLYPVASGLLKTITFDRHKVRVGWSVAPREHELRAVDALLASALLSPNSKMVGVPVWHEVIGHKLIERH